MSVTIDGSAGVTTTTGAVYNSIQSKTAISASGTSVNFTDIPSWVKRITVMFNGVSTNGTSGYQIQLGSGSVTTTGYNCIISRQYGGTVATATSTTGFFLNFDNAAFVVYGNVVFTLNSSNTWIAAGIVGSIASTNLTELVAGNIALSGTLDRVRITTVNGTDTFDAGSINILYE